MLKVLYELTEVGVKIPQLSGFRAGRTISIYTPVEGEPGYYRERQLTYRELGEGRAEVTLEVGASCKKYEVALPISNEDLAELVAALRDDLEV